MFMENFYSISKYLSFFWADCFEDECSIFAEEKKLTGSTSFPFIIFTIIYDFLVVFEGRKRFSDVFDSIHVDELVEHGGSIGCEIHFDCNYFLDEEVMVVSFQSLGEWELWFLCVVPQKQTLPIFLNGRCPNLQPQINIIFQLKMMDRNTSQQSGQKTSSVLISQLSQIAVIERLLYHLQYNVVGMPMGI